MITIYLIRNRTNEKVYVGKTKRSLNSRMREHLYYSKKPDDLNGDFLLNRAIRKYGEESFEIEVLATVGSEREGFDLESLWIITLGSYNPEVGYNMTYGGEGISGFKHSDKVRKSISSKLRGHYVSEETKIKIGNALRGKQGALRGRPSPLRGRKFSNSSMKGKSKTTILGLERAMKFSSDIIRSKLGKVFITNGSISKLVDKNLCLPAGWRYGLTRIRRREPTHARP